MKNKLFILFTTLFALLFALAVVDASAYGPRSKAKRMDAISQALDDQEQAMRARQRRTQQYQRPQADPQLLQEYERVYSRQQIDQFQRQRGEYMEVLEPEDPHGESPLRASFSPVVGWRKDDFDWNISGVNGGAPNIANEYIWTDLKTYSLGGETNIAIKNRLILNGMYRYGWIYNGVATISEYNGNNRTSQATEIKADSSDGSTIDFSTGLGYRFYLGEEDDLLAFQNFWLTVLGGYAYRELNLNLNEGVLRADSSGMNPLGPFDGLDSPYEAEWKGPWLGFALSGDVSERIAGDFTFQYHFADYEATGQLNLNPSFAQPESFAQTGDGRGLVFNVGMDVQLTKKLFLNLDGSYEDWEVLGGEDTAFLVGGGTQNSRLNEVNWRNYGFTLGATYQFE